MSLFVPVPAGSPIPIPDFVFKGRGMRPLISMDGLELVKHFESCALKSYLDPVGVPTLGFGRINWTDGRRVKLGESCTIEEAYKMLFEDLQDEGAQYVWKFTLRPELLSECQWSALVSFTYNRGAGRFDEQLDDLVDAALKDGLFDSREASGLTRTLLTYNWSGSRSNQRKLLGLVRRRYAEAEMFNGGNWRKFSDGNWQKYIAQAYVKRVARGMFA